VRGDERVSVYVFVRLVDAGSRMSTRAVSSALAEQEWGLIPSAYKFGARRSCRAELILIHKRKPDVLA
jgi:hypothetical protein